MSTILPGDAARLASWRALADELARHSDSDDGPMESRAGHAAGALRGAAAMIEALIAERPDTPADPNVASARPLPAAIDADEARRLVGDAYAAAFDIGALTGRHGVHAAADAAEIYARHLATRAALLAALGVADDAPACRCTFAQSIVGDGCSVCQPERAAELSADDGGGAS